MLPSNGDKPVALAPGMYVSIYGRGLGPQAACTARPEVVENQVHYGRELCDVRVLLEGEPVELLYVQGRQINFRVPPEESPNERGELRVVYQDRESRPATVRLGYEGLSIRLAEPAYVDGPVWLAVTVPYGWAGSPKYPFSLDGSSMGCWEAEVRREERLLTPVVLARPPTGYVNGPSGCSSIATSGDSRRAGQLPIHMRFRFDEPGNYEVRLTAGGSLRGYQPTGERRPPLRSAWTPIEVLSSNPLRRQEWLDETAKTRPTDEASVLSDFLPSILGIPDEASLALLADSLYHSESTVRRFASESLRYWPPERVHAAVQMWIEDRGPSDVLAPWVLAAELGQDDTDRMIARVLPYLRSSDPVLLRGAVEFMRSVLLNPDVRTGLASARHGRNAVIQAADHVAATADGQTRNNYADALGRIRNERSRALLWSWVERRIAFSQSLYALAWLKYPEDLARLAEFLVAPADDDRYAGQVDTLAQVLATHYGEAALPYIEKAADESGHRLARREYAWVLIRAGRSSGWRLLGEILEVEDFHRSETRLRLRDYFPDLPSDLPGLKREVKRRSQP